MNTTLKPGMRFRATEFSKAFRIPGLEVGDYITTVGPARNGEACWTFVNERTRETYLSGVHGCYFGTACLVEGVGTRFIFEPAPHPHSLKVGDVLVVAQGKGRTYGVPDGTLYEYIGDAAPIAPRDDLKQPMNYQLALRRRDTGEIEAWALMHLQEGRLKAVAPTAERATDGEARGLAFCWDAAVKQAPAWAKFLALDRNGQIYAYSHEPVPDEISWGYKFKDLRANGGDSLPAVRVDETADRAFSTEHWHKMVYRIERPAAPAAQTDAELIAALREDLDEARSTIKLLENVNAEQAMLIGQLRRDAKADDERIDKLREILGAATGVHVLEAARQVMVQLRAMTDGMRRVCIERTSLREQLRQRTQERDNAHRLVQGGPGMLQLLDKIADATHGYLPFDTYDTLPGRVAAMGQRIRELEAQTAPKAEAEADEKVGLPVVVISVASADMQSLLDQLDSMGVL